MLARFPIRDIQSLNEVMAFVEAGLVGGFSSEMATSDDVQGGIRTVDEGPFAG